MPGKPSRQKWHSLGENCFVNPKICLADRKLNNMIEEGKLSEWKASTGEGPLFTLEDWMVLNDSSGCG